MQNLVDLLEDDFPQNTEPVTDSKQRCDAFRQLAVKRAEELPEGQKLAIVAHSMFFKLMTATSEYWAEFTAEPVEKQEMPSNAQSTLLMNCEMRALLSEY